MAGPASLKRQTLAALRAVRRDMSSAAWLSSLAEETPEARRKAAFAMLEVAQAILAMENGKLGEMGVALKRNEAALTAGREELEQARKRLQKTGAVLAATAKLLDAVARVVSLPAALT